MLLQNRDAFCDALITDMCGCARYKPSDLIGLAAAKRTAGPRRRLSWISGTCFKQWGRVIDTAIFDFGAKNACYS
jgi:hypothetical protein